MGGESGDFVAESFGGHNGHFGKDLFVGVEVTGEFGVVLLDEDFGGSFHGFRSYSSHSFII
jgi:hypothetical protein